MKKKEWISNKWLLCICFTWYACMRNCSSQLESTFLTASARASCVIGKLLFPHIRGAPKNRISWLKKKEEGYIKIKKKVSFLRFSRSFSHVFRCSTLTQHMCSAFIHSGRCSYSSSPSPSSPSSHVCSRFWERTRGADDHRRNREAVEKKPSQSFSPPTSTLQPATFDWCVRVIDVRGER